MSKQFFPDSRSPTYLSQGQQQLLDPSTSSPSTLLNIDIMDTHTYTGSTDVNVSFDRISLLERSIVSFLVIQF